MTPEIPEAGTLVAAADTPLMILVAWMLHLLRRDLGRDPGRDGGRDPGRAEAPPATGLDRTREDLAAFKLEVARTYVPLSLIRDLDSRLSLHLLRIEEKLEEVSRAATAAAAVSGQHLPRPGIGFGLRGQDGQP